MKSTKRPSTLQMMKQASIPSSPAPSTWSQATSSSASSLSSLPSSCYIYTLASFYVLFIIFSAGGGQSNHPRTLISVSDYEEGFYKAVRAVYGSNGIEESPAGVTAIFEANRLSVERVYESGNALLSSGSESSKFFMNEHLTQQEMTHFRNKEDVFTFYSKALNQTQGYEQVFLQSSMEIERWRINYDKLNRILFSNSSSSSCTSLGTVVQVHKKFSNTKMHEDCKVQIREMVLRNPVESLYIKSEKKYVLFFCSHVLCPIPGRDLQEKVGSLYFMLALNLC